MSNERESKTVHEGFRGRHVLYAFLGGAAAGAIAVLLTAEKGREKARHLPDAFKAATVAAKQAFAAALEEAPEKKPAHRHPVS